MNSEQFKNWCDLQPQLIEKKQSPLIMGVLNLTPDSFSDGGQFTEPRRALERAHQMIAEGADLIDIGGESTKPGATPVSVEEELRRVIPIIKALRSQSDICISIDTSKAEVMESAVSAGATMINDIKALTSPDSLAIAASLDVPVCLMHMRGEPQTMQDNPHYETDVVDWINLFFQQSIARCLSAGIKLNHIILDPGFGFGKTTEHNLRLINQLAKFKQHNLPLLLGVSRKTTLGVVLEKSLGQRLIGGIAVAVYAATQGTAIIRTHDIAETKMALKMLNAIHEAEHFC